MKLLIGGAVAALVALAPLAAEAHGPTRKKVEEKVTINAAPEKVWAVVGNFQDMSWLPPVEKTEGKGGNEVKATRTLTLKGGATVEEELYKYSAENKSLSYRINKVDLKVLPVNNYSSTIKVEPSEGGKSTVTWDGAFYRGYMNNDPPPELSDEAAVKAVTELYKAGLENLKTKLEKSGS
ncbi:SRPBCC family protein [Methylobacterium nodulans]|uniref:Putative signal peptide n=1 Tax=Methylobacterium nodulans (strain LMG 21967 / CNCM I-2342 / ORS 2060) TaxID=460265 RepID=B8ILG9_METNO|nr:SRPBCC family protein [Methylobacterium nodulans]ACL60168.1 putative signal peptide [Methylobacterium nodulans ORS 2060]